MTKPCSPIVKILRSKYGLHKGSWLCVFRNVTNISGFWRGILRMREIFRHALQIIVGNGKCTSFWTDKWRGIQCLADAMANIYNVTNSKERPIRDMYNEGDFMSQLSRERTHIRGRAT